MESNMKIEKKGDGYMLSSGGGQIVLSRDAFEDLYYAIPLSTTALYRLLTDQVPRNDGEREKIVGIIESGGDPDKELTDLQEQVRRMKID